MRPSSKPRQRIYRTGWKHAVAAVLNQGATLLVLEDGHAELIEQWWEYGSRSGAMMSGATYWLSKDSTAKAQEAISRARGDAGKDHSDPRLWGE
jgi:cytosine/uracil/thiamine/allantoin permease